MNSTNNLLDKAKTSNCTQTLHDLAQASDASIRRAVARNIHTLSDTLNKLATDPVLNVSFMATQHPKCTLKREFHDTSNPCVVCEKDERDMVCVNCQTLKEYYQ